MTCDCLRQGEENRIARCGKEVDGVATFARALETGRQHEDPGDLRLVASPCAPPHPKALSDDQADRVWQGDGHRLLEIVGPLARDACLLGGESGSHCIP